MKSVSMLIAAAVSEGYILRNSEDWKNTKFAGGELVVSDTTGARGTVTEVREGRPWGIELQCLAEGCKGTRSIKVQDFFQVTGCSEKCKKAVRNEGLKVTATSHPSASPRTKNPVKMLDEALASGAVSKEEYDHLLPAAQKQLADREAQLKKEATERAHAQKQAALRKKVEALNAQLKTETKA